MSLRYCLPWGLKIIRFRVVQNSTWLINFVDPPGAWAHRASTGGATTRQPDWNSAGWIEERERESVPIERDREGARKSGRAKHGSVACLRQHSRRQYDELYPVNALTPHSELRKDFFHNPEAGNPYALRDIRGSLL